MNKKIIIPLLVVILLVIIIFTIFFSFFFGSQNKKNSQQTITQDNKSTSLATDDSDKNKSDSTQILQNSSDFKVIYSTQADKYVVIKKTTASDQKINDWLIQNNLSTTSNNVQIVDQSNKTTSELAGNPESDQTINLTLYPSGALLSPTINNENNSKLIVDLLSILTNIGTTENGSKTITPSTLLSPSVNLAISPTNKKGSKKPAGKYIYYAQCGGGFDSYPLPSGCTVCYAGCGPTTVAMIAASYADKSITPKTVVDLYKQKGYFLGCAGSRATDAKSALSSYGIKTTDFMTFSSATIDVAAKDFKNYMNSGWTIFVLTYFCDGGCGHFFWLTEIGSNNTAWAYDPYYGKGQTPPINENTRYPFPKYRMAFGVKK